MEIERKSSIEREPRTLSFHDIQYAREAALYVIKNKSIEEALRIFTEGLEPVVRSGGGNEKMTVLESEDEEEKNNFAACLSLPPLFMGFRDVVTAPF
ncbi:hypothetical protein AAC387_Pa11g1917 [Persea americana]